MMNVRSIGVTFLAGRGWAPYASYSESFEAVTGVNAHDEPFEPKRGTQFEAGVKWSPPTQPFAVTAAAYELKEKNRLTADPDDPTNQVQKGVVRVRGFELTGTEILWVHEDEPYLAAFIGIALPDALWGTVYVNPYTGVVQGLTKGSTSPSSCASSTGGCCCRGRGERASDTTWSARWAWS